MSHRPTLNRGMVALLFAAALVFGIDAASAVGAPAALWQRCEGASNDTTCNFPRGVDVSPATGNVYVADQGNRRIVEFSPWGVFLRAWGKDVVASGPDDSGSGFEICVPADGDVCQAGSEGPGKGEMSPLFGIAVDPAGDVYVVDYSNHRVQKFDSEGHFLLMIGGEVNKTRSEEGGSSEAQRNLCTAASGDECQKGVSGAGHGQFGAWILGDYLAAGPGGQIYVGDVNRIQVFDAGGEYQSEIAVTGTVQSLATDSSGDLYAALLSKDDVLKWGPPPGFAPQASIAVKEPRGLATDPAKNLYVITTISHALIRKFNPGGVEQESWGQEEPPIPKLGLSVGIAIGSACFENPNKAFDVYVPAQGPSFLRAYGPAPDKTTTPSCEKPEYAPQILSQFTVSVNSEAAVVRASINPRFYAGTSSYVQYGSAACLAGGWPAAEAAECLKEQPAPPGPPLGAGAIDFPSLTGPVALRDLSPGTEYRYRFVADSKGGGPVHGRGGTPAEEGADAHFRTYPAPGSTGECPNEAYRTGLGAQLPDCRAYEMVSPVDKEGADIRVAGTTIFRPASLYKSASSGDRFTFSAFRSFGDAESTPYSSQYLATRGVDGWGTHGISPPRGVSSGLNEGKDAEFKAFSSDLCTAWLIRDKTTAPPLTPDAPLDTAVLYKRSNCGPTADTYESLLTVTPPHRPLLLELQGAPDVGTRAFFGANDSLASGAPDPGTPVIDSREEGRLLYVSSSNGVPRPGQLVCRLPDGTPSQTCSAGTATEPEPDNRSNTVGRAVSADGSRVYWSSSFREAAPLYVRVNPSEAQSALDGGGRCKEEEEACTYPVSTGKAQFWTASVAGNRAFFTAGAPGNDSVMSADLFEFDLEAALAGSAEPVRLVAPEVAGLVGASEDASRLYMVSKEVLDEQPNSEGAFAGAGVPNLYLYERGKGNFVFIATLANDDAVARTSAFHNPSPVNIVPYKHDSRVSGNGESVTFMSRAPLTGADNSDINSGEADAEVFRYDARTDKLSCVSCNPSGARPTGEVINPSDPVGKFFWAAAQLPNPESQLYASHVLSDDGTRVFFESFEPLVSTDTNGKQDVYEWEAPGAGTCTASSPRYTPPDEGCLSLISGGESPQDSDLLDATPTGSDVFFRTGASLVGRDPGLFDVYDARVEGGFSEPQPNPPCEGEACQSPPAAPESQTPASSAYHGPGDLPARSRCAAGARRAKRLALRARRTHRAARRLAAGGSAPQARKTAHRARRLSRRARALHRRARRCRRAAHNARRSR